MKPLRMVADQNMRAVSEFFSPLGDIFLVDGRHLKRADLVDTDILLVRSVTSVNAQLLEGTAVRFVGTATSGFDHIDQAWLANQGIDFAYAPGSNANSVVEYVLAAIARVGDRLERLLGGGSLGVIGYGHIGRVLVEVASALGIQTQVYDPWVEDRSSRPMATLSEVLACDVVSIHAQLTDQSPWPSRHLLSHEQLSSMLPETLLINAGRGEVIDGSALLALKRGGGGPRLVLDVWEGEPGISTQLLEETVLGTAHIAGYSHDGKILATRMLRDSVLRHCGEPATDSAGDKVKHSPLLAPLGLTGIEFLRWLLSARYDIEADDLLLREAVLGQPQGKTAGAFDRLRKDYRVRRELRGSCIQAAGLDGAVVDQAIALGCHIDTGGQ